MVLYAGGIALFVCICLCISVFIYLKGEYTKLACSEFNDQHISAGEELGRHIYSLAFDMRGGVRDLGRLYGKNFEERLDTVTNELVEYEAFSHLFYLGSDGMFYGDKNTKVPGNADYIENAYTELEGLNYDGDGIYIGMRLSAIGSQSEPTIMIVTPVYSNKAIRGYITGIVDTDKLFGSPLFDYQKSRGKCFVVDSEGKILAETAAISNEDTESFRESVLKICRDTEENRNAIAGIRYALNNNESGYVVVRTKQGLDMQINFCPVMNVPDLSYLCCYNPGLQDEMFRPMLFYSVLACVFIMVLMIICMMMVWANAKRTNMTVEKLAYEDPVTKGKNLSYFREFALDSIVTSPNTPYAIYRFDISNFRYINESYGHIRADHILEACIKNFEEIFSDKELCVRMNSDQFLALVINDATLEKRKNEFRAAVNADTRSSNIKYPIRDDRSRQCGQEISKPRQ